MMDTVNGLAKVLCHAGFSSPRWQPFHGLRLEFFRVLRTPWVGLEMVVRIIRAFFGGKQKY